MGRERNLKKMRGFLALFLALRASIIQGGSVRERRDENPEDIICPSERCWHANTETNECTLKRDADCLALQCLKEKIEVSFPSALFADSDALVFASDAFHPVFDAEAKRWKISCAIGECGMTAHTVIEMAKALWISRWRSVPIRV